MRLSTKTRYGVRAIFDIAYHGQDSVHASAQARDIARREDIPLRYLEQIFQDLKRAGLVDSKRGPRGGYYLKRTPEEISLAEVVRALQGPIEEMFLVEEGEPTPARLASTEPSSRQITAALWRELAEHVLTWFAGMTVADLVKRGNQLGVPRAGAGQPMYYI
ncbi:MAG TPA: Rrf2 family transcriptional regulator [Kofleriaceae bacterium]|nr:Rrf2 family transcriptional regulator [Kofleriaceae bacterium]